MAVLVACSGDVSVDGTPTTPVEQSTTTTSTVTSTPTMGIAVELVARLEPTEPYDQPIQLEIDEIRGLVSVTDSRNGRIVVFSVDGTEKKVITGADGPFQVELEGPVGGVDLDANGNLYVAETGRARIVRLEPDGTEVADWGNSRLQHLGADGSVIDVIGPFPPDTSGAMERPNDIAIDADGRLWVADVHGNQVLVFAADGSFLTSFGGSGDPDLPNDPASLVASLPIDPHPLPLSG